MALDFQGAYTELNRRLHGSLSNTAFLASLKAWVNLARKELVSFKPDWYFLQNTATIALVNGTRQYSLDSSLVKLNPEEVRLTTTLTRLLHVETKDFEYILPTPATAGTPTHFRLVGYQKIDLYPPPNAAAVSAETSVTYEFTKTFTAELTSDGASLEVPTQFEPILLNLAESMGWMNLRRVDMANLAFSKATAALQSHMPNDEFVSRFSRNIAPPLMSDKVDQLIEGRVE